MIIYNKPIIDLKSDLDDEIDEVFWLRYMLGTWLRQVVLLTHGLWMMWHICDIKSTYGSW